MTFEVEKREAEYIPAKRIWFPLAAGPLLWAFHLAISYALVSWYCNWEILNVNLLGLPGLQAVIGLISILLLAVIAFSGVTAYQIWNEARRRDEEVEAELREPAPGRYRFMAFLGVLFAGIFGAAILVALIPTLVISPCR